MQDLKICLDKLSKGENYGEMLKFLTSVLYFQRI